MVDSRGMVDLHCHTHYSDGTYSPEELVQEACRLGLAAIAVADHDTVRGIEPVRAAAGGQNLKVMAAVELSATDDKTDVHILGYGVDPANTGFGSRLEEFRRARHGRAEEMLRLLGTVGVHIDMAEIEAVAGHGAVGRPHVAAVLLKRGYVKSVGEAFARYIGYDGPAYVPKFRLELAETISLLREVGAVPVLAHPGTIRRDELIPQLVEAGMMGLEVVHPKHTADTEAHYRALARRFGLIATGGSDTHGRRDGPEPLLGRYFVSPEVVGELERLRQSLVKGRETG